MRLPFRRRDRNQAARDAIALLTACRMTDVDALTEVAYSLDTERLVGASVTLASWLLMEWESYNPNEIDGYLQRLGLRVAAADRRQ